MNPDSDYDLAYSLQLQEAMAASSAAARRHRPAVVSAHASAAAVANSAVVVAPAAAARASFVAAAPQPASATTITASATSTAAVANSAVVVAPAAAALASFVAAAPQPVSATMITASASASAAARRHRPAVVSARASVAGAAAVANSAVVVGPAAAALASFAAAAPQPTNATTITASATSTDAAPRLAPAIYATRVSVAAAAHGPVATCRFFSTPIAAPRASSAASATQPANATVITASAAGGHASGTVVNRAVLVAPPADARAFSSAASRPTASVARRHATGTVANSAFLVAPATDDGASSSAAAAAATRPANAATITPNAARRQGNLIVAPSAVLVGPAVPPSVAAAAPQPANATTITASAHASSVRRNALAFANSKAGRRATGAVAARASLAAALPSHGDFVASHPSLFTAAANRAADSPVVTRATFRASSSVSQPANAIIIGDADTSNGAIGYANCAICMTAVSTYTTLTIQSCKHRFCFPCLTKHVEVWLLGHPGPPRCPHHGCATVLKPSYFNGVLSPNLLRMMEERVSESTIAEGDKVYCPYPACSALMSKSSMKRKAKPYGNNPKSKKVKCIKCNKSLCLDCKGACPAGTVHSCGEEEKKNPLLSSELKELAKQKNWRRCVKCNHMIELFLGCFHVTCRCGHEFCYKCGSARISKTQAGCPCLSWNEANIVYDAATIFGQ